jgi:hypothetical protein
MLFCRRYRLLAFLCGCMAFTASAFSQEPTSQPLLTKNGAWGLLDQAMATGMKAIDFGAPLDVTRARNIARDIVLMTVLQTVTSDVVSFSNEVANLQVAETEQGVLIRRMPLTQNRINRRPSAEREKMKEMLYEGSFEAFRLLVFGAAPGAGAALVRSEVIDERRLFNGETLSAAARRLLDENSVNEEARHEAERASREARRAVEREGALGSKEKAGERTISSRKMTRADWTRLAEEHVRLSAQRTAIQPSHR